MFHARTKHIEIDFHFVRDKVASKNLVVRFISTKDQKADIFTKPLVSTRYSTLRDNLSIMEIPLQLRGHIKASEDIQQTSKDIQPISNTENVIDSLSQKYQSYNCHSTIQCASPCEKLHKASVC
jgi:hypothetical protein